MIRIETIDESVNDGHISWGTKMTIEGDEELCTHQLISIFDAIYKEAPALFEIALIESKYAKDHT